MRESEIRVGGRCGGFVENLGGGIREFIKACLIGEV